MTLCRLFGLVLAVLMMVVEATAQLPPDIQADRYLVEAERHIGNGDSAAAKAALDRILSLQAEHDLALPEAFWFKHAQVSLQAGSYAEAVESVTRYLTTAGREGAHYREALELLDQATAAAGEQQEAERLAEEIRRMPRTVRNGIGMEFVLIEPGTFEMGSPETESGRADNEGPVHEVTLGQPFYLGKYEVTQGQWEAVMGNNPSRFDDCGRTCPVERVSWEDAQAFIAELNRREGVGTYRLPTEAEWEYAARGGRQSGGYVYAGSNRLSSVGWYTENSGDKTHPVGRKQPNELGLYDMSGNVWEWVQDWYDDDYYSSSPATDPHGPATGARRVYRGGSWNYLARYCRAAYRNRAAPGYRNSYLGVRLARTP